MLLWVFLILAGNLGFRVFFFRGLFLGVIPAGPRVPGKGVPGRGRAACVRSRRRGAALGVAPGSAAGVYCAIIWHNSRAGFNM